LGGHWSLIPRFRGAERKSPHPDTAPHRRPSHEGVMRAPDFISQLLDIAGRKLRVDAGAAGVLQFDLDGVQINHDIPLL
jgi:hypothetical protein